MVILKFFTEKGAANKTSTIRKKYEYLKKYRYRYRKLYRYRHSSAFLAIRDLFVILTATVFKGYTQIAILEIMSEIII
jgi:hypothetical protein